MTISGEAVLSILKVKIPVDGSSGDFHDLKDQLVPSFKFNPSFIPGRNVSVGKSKLCHKKSPLFSSYKTKFPDSKSL
ncbi:hypothetical protein Scep_028635 [Stephania cephalantha]|uniref:Uncharacterized protein n=1 Tax=Stephania cephalantha TaxID=152367 RepID=A0AAP0EEJ7_9MAGN